MSINPCRNCLKIDEDKNNPVCRNCQSRLNYVAHIEQASGGSVAGNIDSAGSKLTFSMLMSTFG